MTSRWLERSFARRPSSQPCYKLVAPKSFSQCLQHSNIFHGPAVCKAELSTVGHRLKLCRVPFSEEELVERLLS
jgi:hypothetical protein